MRLQGCPVDAVTLHDELLAGWVVVVLWAQQFSKMTYAVDFGVNGDRTRKSVNLYCNWCSVTGNTFFFVVPSFVQLECEIGDVSMELSLGTAHLSPRRSRIRFPMPTTRKRRVPKPN
jgi:hypothetical protein